MAAYRGAVSICLQGSVEARLSSKVSLNELTVQFLHLKIRKAFVPSLVRTGQQLKVHSKKKEKIGEDEEESETSVVKHTKHKNGTGKESHKKGSQNGTAFLDPISVLNEKMTENSDVKSSKKHKGGDEQSSTFHKHDFGEIQPSAHYPDTMEAHSSLPEHPKKKKNYSYSKELEHLHLELVKLQEWINMKGLKVVVIFEGRDAAGKGGIIKTITDPLNPRVCSVHALGTPSDREKKQWYFQRYVPHLPAAGEMVIFDRSWYNRAGVERVMGFCNDDEYKEFLRSCPEFERMIVRSGIHLIKYWVSVSPEEQEKRFKERLSKPEKRWKLSPMDLYARARWSDYSYAKDVMFSCCDIKQAPWHVIPADDKKAARLNCISHLLSQFSYESLIVPNDVEIPPLQEQNYVRPPMSDQSFVPLLY